MANKNRDDSQHENGLTSKKPGENESKNNLSNQDSYETMGDDPEGNRIQEDYNNND